VAETARTRSRNRDAVRAFLDRIEAPAVEVVLCAPLDTLLERYAARQASAEAHRIYRKFPAGTENRLLAQPYEPLLPADRVLEVDATDPPSIDVADLAAWVRALVSGVRDRRDR
jgi:hypothetical protein